jgi:hypothetical protein
LPGARRLTFYFLRSSSELSGGTSILAAATDGQSPAKSALVSNAHSPERRLTNELKKAGYKITPLVTRRYLDLLKRHRPELFPSIQEASMVVPFRSPDHT